VLFVVDRDLSAPEVAATGFLVECIDPLERSVMVSKAVWALVVTIAIGFGAIFVGLIVVALTYVAALPESNCHTSTLSETWSADRAYQAAIQVKDCNAGQTQFYSVRVHAHSVPQLPHGGWFATYEVQDDEDNPYGPPEVHWETPRVLSIDMKTRTLRGSIRQNAGDDLTVVETYTARAPDQFPSF
jgi:hypothetical protein